MDPTVHELYESEFVRLMRHAQYIVGSPEVAEDMVQEAFIRLMRTPPSKPDRVRAWLKTVVGHLALDYLRHQKRHDKALSNLEDRSLLSESPEDISLLTFDLDRMKEALAELGERDQKALWLRHSGYSYQEIAKRVGCPADQVGVLLIRAMKKLRSHYEVKVEALREVGL